MQTLPLARCVLAVVLFSLLPSFAVAALMLAEAPPAIFPGQEVANYLADKSINYWFLTLAGIAIGSWTWIAKWLIQQLEAQRAVNAATTDKLVRYMEEDHSKTLVVMQQVTAILSEVVKRMEAPKTP